MLTKHKKQKTGRPTKAQSLGLPPGTWKTNFGAPTTVLRLAEAGRANRNRPPKVSNCLYLPASLSLRFCLGRLIACSALLLFC